MSRSQNKRTRLTLKLESKKNSGMPYTNAWINMTKLTYLSAHLKWKAMIQKAKMVKLSMFQIKKNECEYLTLHSPNDSREYILAVSHTHIPSCA